jgi:ribonucleoside-diphosphate reductase alpha chain
LWNKIRAANLGGRRTGLGITALGDCLAMLNVKYGSVESVDHTYKIYRSLAKAAHRSSCVMAKERGAFPIFSYKKEKDHGYLKEIMHDAGKDVETMWKKTGRRNIALTTTAPTGSVSTLTQTTSGIEPAYMLSYVRRKKHNPSDKNARVDFTDAMGDKWQEFTIYHHGVKTWMDVTGETDISKSPYYGATSNDIDWAISVDLQAAAQKSVDHSISKTCNLPNSATKELVSEVYMRAWSSGCKGFTVYRDGCRTGVLISEADAAKKNTKLGDRPAEIEIVMAPKRPIELVCDIKKAKVDGEGWTIFVGLLNGKPYEIFGGLSKFIDIPNKHKMGKIIKNGKNSDGITGYNLVIGDGEDQMMIKDIASIFENKSHEAFTRMISLNLRHGTPIQYVVEQLTKDKYAEMASFSRVVARVLKTYIKDGSKSAAEKKCTSCGLEGTLVYQEGCITCTACKYSKCG